MACTTDATPRPFDNAITESGCMYVVTKSAAIRATSSAVALSLDMATRAQVSPKVRVRASSNSMARSKGCCTVKVMIPRRLASSSSLDTIERE